MPKARLPYPAEFRQKIVDLVPCGRSVKELAAQFEPSEQTIRNWLAQADPILGNARIS
jgi:transposase